MNRIVEIRKVNLADANDDEEVLVIASWCQSFLCKFKGLMLQKSLQPAHGVLLVERQMSSRLQVSIHMLFMRFSIAVIWLDANGTVVDTCLAEPWRLSYIPQESAQYVL